MKQNMWCFKNNKIKAQRWLLATIKKVSLLTYMILLVPRTAIRILWKKSTFITQCVHKWQTYLKHITVGNRYSVGEHNYFSSHSNWILMKHPSFQRWPGACSRRTISQPSYVGPGHKEISSHHTVTSQSDSC